MRGQAYDTRTGPAVCRPFSRPVSLCPHDAAARPCMTRHGLAEPGHIHSPAPTLKLVRHSQLVVVGNIQLRQRLFLFQRHPALEQTLLLRRLRQRMQTSGRCRGLHATPVGQMPLPSCADPEPSRNISAGLREKQASAVSFAGSLHAMPAAWFGFGHGITTGTACSSPCPPFAAAPAACS